MTTLRAAHLVGISGIGGGFLYDSPREIWLPFLVLALASGILMALLEVWSSPYWLAEVRGLSVALKVLLLLSTGLVPRFGAAALILVVVLSAFSSHAPAAVRYYSVWHGRRTH